jgi:hypothetical protein
MDKKCAGTCIIPLNAMPFIQLAQSIFETFVTVRSY